MIYWFTKTPTSSARLYYETEKAGRFGPPEFRVSQPVGIAIFPREVMRPPRRWVQHFYNVKRWSEMPSGGHFAALEEPMEFVEELRAFFYDDLGGDSITRFHNL